MNPAYAKAKWKKNSNTKLNDFNSDDDLRGRRGMPQEKYGKRKFKIQREVEDYFASSYY